MEELSMDEQNRNNNRKRKKICLITFMVAIWIIAAFTAFNSWRSGKGHIEIKVKTLNNS